jgi:hypothetical protein
MGLDSKPLEKIVKRELLEMITEEEAENCLLEFKQALPGNNETKMGFVPIAIVLILASCFCTPALANWFSGGNLHKATGYEWQRATEANRLATSADFIASTIQLGWRYKGQIIRPQSVDGLLPFAIANKNCITKATSARAGYSQKISEISAMCNVMMGWSP